ncbi:MAG: hypothetical protein Q9162_003610 [Coniocarpon cinnabarinum]
MAPLKSWHAISPDSSFSLHNLPFGIITHASLTPPHPAIAIGEHALDLQLFTAASGFRDCSPLQPYSHVFSAPTLNAFAALGQPLHSITRKYIQSIFLVDGPYPEVLERDKSLQERCLIPLSQVTMHLPMAIGDYTDFYAGLHHAQNCGTIMRGFHDALQANYRHLPVAYHGRASSIIVSGTPVTRPKGQILPDPSVKKPTFEASRRLDFELELGCFMCKSSKLGEPILVNEAHEYLFGVVLLNDWSARDFQSWEMAPLGPFTSKNFSTSVSPWVVLMEALEPFRCEGISNEGVEVLPYLQQREKKSMYDIDLSVSLTAANEDKDTLVTRTSGGNLLWSFSQMLAHHTAGGCNINVGDLIGSGTVSGTEEGTFGSMLESTFGGKKTLELGAGAKRTFLEDGDTVTLKGICGEEGARVGFGTCIGQILPAKS